MAVNQVEHKYTNALINSTSPYLLQHAHNPVSWYPWGEEALEKAKQENKLLIISIGYSACHWCHVMEHESFEDEEVAQLMNEHFVSIKIDREERPDIDQVYMNAVHLMNQRGGWPLNCFALPDGKPFYGGTYFPKAQWTQLLQKVHQEYQNNSTKVVEFAHRLTQGIQQSELIQLNSSPALFQKSTLDEMVDKWLKRVDYVEGGPNRAPKFPLPNNYQFLLRYAFLNDNQKAKDHVEHTLRKMAHGGIYDQIGGGFARYSTDKYWKVPHFEKMLYDNAQLVSLYAEAYQAYQDPLFKDVVYETLDFIERELTADEGVFFSALDADSEGEEGKFYVWQSVELKEILGDDFQIFKELYSVNEKGLWEHGNYILLRDKPWDKIAKKHNLSLEKLNSLKQTWNVKLLDVRNRRIHPGLDDKSLTSWNALMIKGFADAYMVFNDKSFLDRAIKSANFILKKQLTTDGNLYHSYKQGTSSINGFLEDYAFTIEAFISLYEATFDMAWLNHAKQLMNHAIDHFYDEKSQMFFFTSKLDPPLVARKMELSDNVIPASNSSIAKGLFLLGTYYDDRDYITKAKTMLNNVQPHMIDYGSGYSNWALLMLNQVNPLYEVAIVGKDALLRRSEFAQHYIPNKLFIGNTNSDKTLPLLENKLVKGATMIYVCVEKSCQLPVTSITKAISQIQ